MRQRGKIHTAFEEIERMSIDIIGVSEMRWQESGNIYIDDYRVTYSGKTGGKHEYGVGIIFDSKMARCVKSVTPVSERILLVQMNATPVDINIVQVYVPTSDAEAEEVEETYAAINKIIEKLKKKKT